MLNEYKCLFIYKKKTTERLIKQSLLIIHMIENGTEVNTNITNATEMKTKV